jgi:serine/threonine protein kinase
MSVGTDSLSIGYLLGGHWRVERAIGEGACAKVYSVSAVDAASSGGGSLAYVAKCIFYGKGLKNKKEIKEKERMSNTLNRERDLLAPGKILTQFQQRPRLPAKFYHGKDDSAGCIFLVMERLDEDLLHWANRQNPLPSVSSLADMGLQLLDGLEWLHRKGWLFIDIKPENFMLRHSDDKLIFIDCKRLIK